MSGRRGPLLLALVGVAVAVALFFVLKEDEEEPAPGATQTEPTNSERDKPKTVPEPEVTQIELADGQPVGGVAEIEVSRGEEIALEVSSDIDDEIHVHGYDIEKPVAAGKTIDVEFPATIEGVFEAESHHGAAAIAEITVNP